MSRWLLKPTFGPSAGGTPVAVHRLDAPHHAASSSSSSSSSAIALHAGHTPLNCSQHGVASAHGGTGGNSTWHCCCMPPRQQQHNNHNNNNNDGQQSSSGSSSSTSSSSSSSSTFASPLTVRDRSNVLLHHAAFTYYATEPTYRWLTPLSGPADGGTPITINAKNWPAPAASPHSGHGRCRFGHHHHAPTTALTFALMSRAAGRARRSAGETYLHCAAPPATNAHEAAAAASAAAAATLAGRPPPVVVLPLLIAPNGVDFLPTNLTYRYEAPPSHEAAFLMSMGPALALCVGVAFVVHALRKLRDEIASSGWGGDTLAHWGAMRHASEEQRRQHRAMKSMRRGGSGGGGGGAGGRGALAPPGEGEDDDEDDDGADVDRAAQQLRVAPISRVVVRAPAELLQPLGCIAEEEHEGQDSPSPHV